MDIRKRILAVIEHRPDLTVRSLSLKAGLSDSMLSKFLKGSTDSMTIRNAEKLAEAMDVDARWLIFGEGDPEPAADIAKLLARIPEEQRRQALAVLEVFARTGTDG